MFKTTLEAINRRIRYWKKLLQSMPSPQHFHKEEIQGIIRELGYLKAEMEQIATEQHRDLKAMF
jgi:hypothetical protein